MITLAVDAMGGDAGLAITVPGAVDFLKQQSDVHLIMVGDEAAVRQALSSAGAPMDRITVCHAAQVVEMDEAPQSALKNKKESSMRIAINQVTRRQRASRRIGRQYRRTDGDRPIRPQNHSRH